MMTPDPDPDAPDALSRAAAITRLVGLTVVLGVIALVALRTGPDIAAVRAVVADAGWVGPGVYVATYALLTLALVPGTVLTLSGGLLFGVTGGSLLTIVGATLGATGAFVVARRTGRPAVDRLVAGRVAQVDGWLADRGLVAILTLRLVPLVPFNAVNYAAGVTAVPLRDYVIGTTVGIVPGVVVYTVLGARADDPTGPAFLAAVAALLLLAVGGSVVARRSSRAGGTETPSHAGDGRSEVPTR